MAMDRHVPVGVAMAVIVVVVVVVVVVVAMGTNHRKMLYYNITGVYRGILPAYGFPIAIAMAAARKGNGSDTAARNQTNRAGMNGISHSSSRWKANSAQAIT